MARYSIGIYWDNISLHACLAKVGISELTVEKVVSMPREYDEHYAPRKKISEELPGLLKDALAEPMDTYVVGIPERESMHRTLLRPFGDRKKIAMTIAPEVETLLPILDGKIFVEYVLLDKDEAGLYRIETMAVRHELVKNLIDDLKSAEADPEIVDSPSAALLAGARNVFKLGDDTSYLFLHMGWHDTSIAVLQGDAVKYTGIFPFGFEKIVRSLFEGKALSQELLKEKLEAGVTAGTLLDAYMREVLIALSRIDLRGRSLVIVPTGYARSITDLRSHFKASFDISDEFPEFKEINGGIDRNRLLDCFMPLSLACRGIDSRDAVNFRKQDLVYTRKLEQIKGYAGVWVKVAAAFIILWLFGFGLNVAVNARLNSQLAKQLVREYSAAMPPGTPMVEPVKQMEQQLARMSAHGLQGSTSGGSTPLEIIRDISSGIPKTLDVIIDSISIEEDAITITGNAASYDNVEKIKESLSGFPYVSGVKIVSANVDKNDQRIRLKVVCDKK